MLSVIIPFGADDSVPSRVPNLHAVVKSLRRVWGDTVRIVLVELVRNNRATDAPPEVDVVLRTAIDGVFSVGRAHNAGWVWAARNYPDEPLYFHQADFLAPLGLRDLDWARELRNAGFLFPYWGEVHLSERLSGAVRNHRQHQDRIMQAVTAWISAHRTANAVRLTSRGEVFHHEAFRPRDANRIANQLLEATGASLVAAAGGLRPYRQFQEEAPTADVTVYSGPRSTGGYFATISAYDEVGGVPMLDGWGYEDLMFWTKVQRAGGFTSSELGTVHVGTMQTKDLPLVHLHHEVHEQSAYYAAAERNASQFDALRRSTSDEFRATVAGDREALHALARC